MSAGKVYLVGAGCGSCDLITLRGKAVLAQAQVVVYDSLIDSTLLDFAPDTAEKIDVGKRAGRHSASQKEINELLIRKAAEGKTVVRLKGGDPFVFGRGGEEVGALQQHGIDYAVVPGITSAIAVPELAGIPATHRGVARSVHIITAHTAQELRPEALGAYAKLGGTLVFLMGLAKLAEIAASLIAYGKPENTPAAVISNGASARERTVRGTLSNIAQLAMKAKLTAPAVIVVGETAAMDLRSRRTSVTVVGTPQFSEKLCAKLTAAGFDAERLGLLRVVPYTDDPAFDHALQQICDYTTAVFTSANGVAVFFEKLKEANFDLRRLAHLQFAVVGAGTAEALKQHGFLADLVPHEYSARSLAALLIESGNTDTNLLILRAAQGSRELDRLLDEHHIRYSDIKLYDIQPIGGRVGEEIGTDHLVFASPSGVSAFFHAGYTISAHTAVIAIGSTTAEALKQHQIDVELPEESTSDGIVRLIQRRTLCSDSDD